ncbi:MAG TPA: iron-sulfur cluster assembly protein [Rhodothermales bacterium]
MRLLIAERLRSVIDPEVGMNIVDLGLLYDLDVEADTVVIRLTMTTPACPMSSYIRQEVGRALTKVPGLRRGITELVWDPPWSPGMIDREASIRRFGIRYVGR